MARSELIGSWVRMLFITGYIKVIIFVYLLAFMCIVCKLFNYLYIAQNKSVSLRSNCFPFIILLNVSMNSDSLNIAIFYVF